MFHAVIKSKQSGPLSVTAEASPYNFQMLREHVLARSGPGTRVEVRLASASHPALRRALRDLDRRGVVLVVHP